VTPDGGDYTEHGVFGLDDQDGLWVLDWWFGQTSSDVWVEKQCDLIYKHKPLMWACERGVIWRSIKPYLTQRMAQRRLHETRIEDLPTTGDKVAMARGAQGMASMGQIRFPMRSSFHERVLAQLVAFPAGTFDDAVDTLGGAVRAIPLVGHPPKRTQIAASAVVDYGIDNELGM
jgi:predicted phage terminase large subunit-like protein